MSTPSEKDLATLRQLALEKALRGEDPTNLVLTHELVTGDLEDQD